VDQGEKTSKEQEPLLYQKAESLPLENEKLGSPGSALGGRAKVKDLGGLMKDRSIKSEKRFRERRTKNKAKRQYLSPKRKRSSGVKKKVRGEDVGEAVG